MIVWVRVLRSEISDVRCGTFIDDRSIRAHSRPALDHAVTLTDEFDALTGSSPNQDKTGLLVTHLPLEQHFQDFYHGPHLISPCASAEFLGVALPSRSAAVCHVGRRRSLSAIEAAHRIQSAPIHFEGKQACIASASISLWRYGLEVGCHPIQEESSLRHSVAEALGFSRSFASKDVFFTLCSSGSLIDPHQIRAS